MSSLSKQSVPTSSVMSVDEALDILSNFGGNLIELDAFQRKQQLQRRKGESILYSLPVESLKHSKWQIQIALAIAIAEYVIRLATEPSDETEDMLDLLLQGCNQLAWFTHQPAYYPLKKTDNQVFIEWINALSAYRWWEHLCEQYLKVGLGETLPADWHLAKNWKPIKFERDKTSRARETKTPIAWPTEKILIQYWNDVDTNISGFLNKPILKAIRQT